MIGRRAAELSNLLGMPAGCGHILGISPPGLYPAHCTQGMSWRRPAPLSCRIRFEQQFQRLDVAKLVGGWARLLKE